MTQFGLLLLMATSLTAPISRAQSQGELPTDQIILGRHLQLENHSNNDTLGNFITELVNELIEKERWCQKEIQSGSVKCVVQRMADLLANANGTGVSDPVIEHGILRHQKNFSIRNGRFEIHLKERRSAPSKKASARIQRKNQRRLVRLAKQGKAEVPSLMSYLIAKEKHRRMRLLKNGDGNIPIELTLKLMKKYPRKAEKVGKIPLESSVLLRYSESQIETLSSVIEKAHQQFTSLATEVVYLREDYRQLLSDIEFIEIEVEDRQQELRNAIDLYSDESATEVPSEIAQAQNELALTLRNLELKRAELAASSSELALELSRKTKNELLQQLSKESDPEKLLQLKDDLDDLEEVILVQTEAFNKQKIVIRLNADDADTLTLNSIEATLATLASEPSFSGRNLEVGDLFGAVLLRGDLSAATALKMTEFSGLQEKHLTKLKQAGQFALNLGKLALMTNPTTSPFVTIGSLLWDSQKNAKKMKQAERQRTRYVR